MNYKTGSLIDYENCIVKESNGCEYSYWGYCRYYEKKFPGKYTCLTPRACEMGTCPAQDPKAKD
jgi:hypothetical protein